MKVRRIPGLGLVLSLAVSLVGASPAEAGGKPPMKIIAQQHGSHAHPAGTSTHEHSKAPVKMTMEELHKHGGTPPGWKFTLPPGDPAVGREVYIAMKCFTCHDVAGEKFPAHKRDVGEVGPDLTGMGAHHPAEYFAEAILNPNTVILLGEGYTGQDELSIMPDYIDTLTVAQWIDLVAYLKSLRGEMKHHMQKGQGHEKSPQHKGHMGGEKSHGH